LRCLIDTSKAILRCIDEYKRPELRVSMNKYDNEELEKIENEEEKLNKEGEDDHLALGAEDKFPILLYCLIKANLQNFFSELAFIKEFANQGIGKEEESYRLIEIEQAVVYIESLDWNVLDNEEVLISVSLLEERVWTALRTARTQYFKKEGVFPRVLWLAEVLLLLGTIRGSPYEDVYLGDFPNMFSKYISESSYVKLADTVFQPIGLIVEKVEKRKKPEIKITVDEEIVNSSDDMSDGAKSDTPKNDKKDIPKNELPETPKNGSNFHTPKSDKKDSPRNERKDSPKVEKTSPKVEKMDPIDIEPEIIKRERRQKRISPQFRKFASEEDDLFLKHISQKTEEDDYNDLESDVKIIFKHTFPQYIYTKLASLIESKIRFL